MNRARARALLGEALEMLDEGFTDRYQGSASPLHPLGERARQPYTATTLLGALSLELRNPTMDDLIDAVRVACPSPTWLVCVQLIPAGNAIALGGSMDTWWAFAEPGIADEPDMSRRHAMRVNCKEADVEVALTGLERYLARLYPKARALEAVR
jgi:hypothetical protein